jgi:hypothetical protein
MNWILLVVTFTVSGGQSVATHEFYSKDTCFAVREDIKRLLPSAHAVCFRTDMTARAD